MTTTAPLAPTPAVTVAAPSTNAATLNQIISESDKNQEKLGAWLPKLGPELAKILPRGYSAERMVKLALAEAQKTADITLCTKESVALSLMRIAQWNLDVGVSAYLVPFNVNIAKRGEADRWIKVCTAVPDYRGLIQMAKQAGVVRDIFAREVWAGDEFDYAYGTERFVKHKPTEDPTKRGALRGAWLEIRLPFDGLSKNSWTFDFMPIADIEAIRAKSKSWGPEKKRYCEPWYARKSAVRHFLNQQPKMGTVLDEALADPDSDAEALERAIEESERLRGSAPRPVTAGAPPERSEAEDCEMDRELAEQSRG